VTLGTRWSPTLVLYTLYQFWSLVWEYYTSLGITYTARGYNLLDSPSHHIPFPPQFILYQSHSFHPLAGTTISTCWLEFGILMGSERLVVQNRVPLISSHSDVSRSIRRAWPASLKASLRHSYFCSVRITRL